MKTLLRLTREVKNPNGDARYKYDPMCKKVWPEGSLWTKSPWRLDLAEKDVDGYQYEGRSHTLPIYQLEEYGLKPGDFEVCAPATWAQINMVMSGYDCCGEVIDLLLEDGRLSVEDVLLAYQAWLDTSED